MALFQRVKGSPLQRVLIIRFVTDREATEKSKILHNKGFLPFLYCLLVYSDRFKCISRATVHYKIKRRLVTGKEARREKANKILIKFQYV